MALTNAEKQRAWRERHIRKRRDAQRVANLLMRQNWPDDQLEELAALTTPLTGGATPARPSRLRNALSTPALTETAAAFHIFDAWVEAGSA